jgi:hypothetical protein
MLRARRLGRRVVILNEDFDDYLNNAERVRGGLTLNPNEVGPTSE